MHLGPHWFGAKIARHLGFNLASSKFQSTQYFSLSKRFKITLVFPKIQHSEYVPVQLCGIELVNPV
jgi:hypothetical protein